MCESTMRQENWEHLRYFLALARRIARYPRAQVARDAFVALVEQHRAALRG